MVFTRQLCFLCVVVLSLATPKQASKTVGSSVLLNAQKGGRRGNPGFKIRISPRGMKYANTQAEKALNFFIEQNMHIPYNKFKFDGGYAELKNVKITKYQPPTFRYSTQAPNRLTWSLHRGTISAEGGWNFEKNLWLFNFRKDGHATASASDVAISLSAAFHDIRGAPQLRNVECTTKIGRLSLKLNRMGFLGWIVNLFRDTIANEWLKPYLEKEACKEAVKFITTGVNDKLHTFPMRKEISRWFRFDYRLSSDPQMMNDNLMSDHRGEIRHIRSRHLDFYPHHMQIDMSGSKMLYFYVSDHILNSFLSDAHKFGKIAYLVDENTLPMAAKYLRTSCEMHETCLDALLPSISEKHPNSKGALRFRTSGPDPTAVFSKGKASMRAEGKIILYVQDATSGENVEALKANILVTAHVQPNVDWRAEMVKGTVVLEDLQISGVESTIEGISDSTVQQMTDGMKPLLQAMANQHIRDGLNIPLTSGAGITNVGLRFLNRTAELSADVNYEASRY